MSEQRAITRERFPVSYELGERLREYVQDVTKTADEVETKARAMVEADRLYRVAWHSCYATSDGPSHAAKAAQADELTVEQRHAAKLAEVLYESAKAANRSTIASASLAQTWASTVRTEMEVSKA